MLRVTVELLPRGRESGRKTLASADITQEKGGEHADYRVELHDEVMGSVGVGALREYPRFATTVSIIPACWKTTWRQVLSTRH